RATGAMGAPAEYFNYQGAMLRMVTRLRPNDLAEYLEQLFAIRTSPNGVFGFKAQWGQFRLVINGALLRLMPRPRYRYRRPGDRVAQAVSFARAEQTGQWVSWRPSRREPTYNYGSIRRSLDKIEREAGWWEAMFARQGIEPIRVSYEALAGDPQAVTDGILARFDLTRDPGPRLESRPMERQSDAVNREWIERFHRDSHADASRAKPLT